MLGALRNQLWTIILFSRDRNIHIYLMLQITEKWFSASIDGNFGPVARLLGLKGARDSCRNIFFGN